MCKIRSGTTELSKPVSITVEVYEGKVEGRYSIDGKAEIPGFTFVVQTTHSRVSEWHQTAEKHLSSRFSPQLSLLIRSDSQHHRDPSQLWAAYRRHSHHSDWTPPGCWADQEGHPQRCALSYKKVCSTLSFSLPPHSCSTTGEQHFIARHVG